jgi:hypothetical protein
MEMNPAKSGYCEKKNNSLWAYWFPCWFETWKKRFFVLVGNYLYRFSSEDGEGIKGVPIPLECATVNYKGGSTFEVSMIRKVYQIRAQSDQDAADWVNAINTRKYEAIRENMGHAPLDAAVKRANKVADFLFSKKLQMDRDMAEANVSNPLDRGHITSY